MSALSSPSLIPSPSAAATASFSDLPEELMAAIADFTENRYTRLDLEYTCKGFAKTAEKCFEVGERWISSFNPDVLFQEQSESFLEMREFYPSLKKRVIQLKFVDSPLREGYIFLMKKHFEKIVSRLSPDFPAPILLNKNFGTKLFFDVVNSYANREIEKITIQSFKKIRYFLHDQYRSFEVAHIELNLRQAIKYCGAHRWKQDQRTLEIEAVRQKCLNPTEDFTLYIRERQTIKSRLEKEIEKIKQIMTVFSPDDPTFQLQSDDIVTIQARLQPEELDRQVREILALQADFYLELNQEVGNPEERTVKLRDALATIALDFTDPNWDLN